MNNGKHIKLEEVDSFVFNGMKDCDKYPDWFNDAIAVNNSLISISKDGDNYELTIDWRKNKFLKSMFQVWYNENGEGRLLDSPMCTWIFKTGDFIILMEKEFIWAYNKNGQKLNFWVDKDYIYNKGE